MGSSCEHIFFQKSIFWLDFPLFNIGLSLIGFSKIGLRPWVKVFLDQAVKHYFFKKKIVDWIFLFKNWIISNLIFQKWLRIWVKYFLAQAVNIYFISRSICLFDFPLFKIGLSQIWFSKIGLRPWVQDFFGIKLWTFIF